MRKWIVCCVLVCSFCLNVVLCCENGKGRIEGRIKTDTMRVTVVDTVTYTLPVARDSVVVRYMTKKLPIVHDTVHPICIDSADVNIPITQKQYCDSTYTAWVSGYEPSLDSIRVYKNREVVTINKVKKEPPYRFVFTLNVGYGITPQNGLQPYIGIGVGYKLFSFGK